MTYLLDTNVISALAPSRHRRREDVADWIDAASDNLYVSVITVVEIRDGIARAARHGASRKAVDLASWWDAVEHLYGERVLSFGRDAAAIAGVLMDRARGNGQSSDLADIAIAAIAQHHRLTILTQNLRHFIGLSVDVLDPFQKLPS